jgi:hypothetical protein
MKATRDLTFLIAKWECIDSADELVEFVDSLTSEETKIMDKAFAAGLCPKNPGYLDTNRIELA